jgi:hypothetical protein
MDWASPILRKPHDFAAEAMNRHMAALADGYREGDGEAIEGAVHRLVGLGPGLTPAGDGALIGWLAGTALLPAEARRDAVCRAIRARLGRTTDISRARLEEYAAQGHFPAGSMGPKIEAIRRYLIATPQGRTIINDPPNLGRALAGETGTRIHR